MKDCTIAPKVLFVRTKERAFIQRDIQLLSKHFDVKILDLEFRKENVVNLIDLFSLIKLFSWADVIFVWFASYHAVIALFLSKIFKKKFIVVVGGYEVAKVPEIGYGLLLNPFFSYMVKFILNNAELVLTVDESLKNDAIKNLEINGKNIITIPTGYDFEKFKPMGMKQDLVITVGYISQNTIKRKGFFTFVKAAELLPKIQFALIGEFSDNSIEYLRNIASKNVSFINYIPENELIMYYQRAKVYCQLSMYEGLPNALCEAMLCGCVPVGTDKCGIPKAIGTTGFYVPYGNTKKTVEAIMYALTSNNGSEARLRIEETFPIAKREKELVRIIKNIAK